jgi:acetyl coenzyme A synthetase (ADP forming)-like protein
MDIFFNPKTIAIIGATPRKNSVGRGLVENLMIYERYNQGIVVYPVNPNRKKVLNKKSFPSVLAIKRDIDLAIIAVPQRVVIQVVKECIEKKVKGIIIISSGFKETGERGRVLEEKIQELIKKAKIPVIGPNSLGILRPSIKLNASFAPAMPKKGEIALISQSGALVDLIIDKAIFEDYGFSKIVSVGNEADLEVSDFLEWLKDDKETKVILLYLESVKSGKKFIKVAKEVSKTKVTVALKAGKSELGIKAVSSHTGALAGVHEIYQAVFKKTKIIEAETIDELLDFAKVLSWQPKTKNGIGIVTNGGGCGILMADYCQEFKINLPPLGNETIKEIEKSKLMPLHWSKRNPVDILGDDSPERYKVAIESLLKQKNIHGLIVIQTVQIMTNPFLNAKIIVRAHKKFPQKPILCCFLGGKLSERGIKVLEKNRIPNFPELKRAAKAMRILINE